MYITAEIRVNRKKLIIVDTFAISTIPKMIS